MSYIPAEWRNTDHGVWLCNNIQLGFVFGGRKAGRGRHGQIAANLSGVMSTCSKAANRDYMLCCRFRIACKGRNCIMMHGTAWRWLCHGCFSAKVSVTFQPQEEQQQQQQQVRSIKASVNSVNNNSLISKHVLCF